MPQAKGNMKKNKTHISAKSFPTPLTAPVNEGISDKGL
jgi:hypothetical protein